MGLKKCFIEVCFFCLVGSFCQAQDRSVPKGLQDTTTSRIDTLKAAVVTATMRIRIKGDTLDFNAEHIRMPPNAVVEELLRRIPGMHVDANGNITYNGQKIQRLLVDGEDIFGSDPSMVTRTFDASKIARIQIIDRKSDQAVFSGFDDGARSKTLNLIMKESAKNGYFGKAEGGGDSQGYYLSDGAVAGFRREEQLTALALASNVGVTAFSNSGAAGSIDFLNLNADALGASAGAGVPRFSAAALHYSNSWQSPDEHLTANYQYSHYFTQPSTTTRSLQLQPDSVFGQQQNAKSLNEQTQHWAYGVYDISPTPKTSIEVTLHGSVIQGENQLSATGSSILNDVSINTSQRNIKDENYQENVGASLRWRAQMCAKSNSVFSLNVGFTRVDAVTNGYLYSFNQYYGTNGKIQYVDTVDQRKQIADAPLTFRGGCSFTQPVFRGTVLAVNVDGSTTSDNPRQATFARGDGKYRQLVDSLSSQLRVVQATERTTINLQGNIGQLTYTVGNGLIYYNYKQENLYDDSASRLHDLNWAPRIDFNYKINALTAVDLGYSQATMQPTIAQLASINNNNDPLHIVVGNPALRPGTSRNFRINVRYFKAWMLDVGIDLGLSQNSFSVEMLTDSLGRQISQPVNVNGGKSAGINASIARKILGVNASLQGSATYVRTNSFVNSELSENDVYNASGGISLNESVPDKFSVYITTNVSYFNEVSDINTSTPIHYWGQSHTGGITIYLVRGFEFNTNAAYTWQQKSNAFPENTSVLLWNSYVSRNFVHDKLVVKAQLNNILNEKAGISRTNIANVNTQSATNILGRYWMLSVTYHFDKKFRK